ncbi:GNAT family N-acetyltransferase [Scatolibacter rhodanostii]|uniref:GNAT family N-acetyltransferase n=1 Tax=Scatolibacter rhodanostii TaxID=2014781 RepID=UPI000C087CB9|nr:GNAT family N-acetyltransferase [Scatolibacter rhodanostii]
MDTQRLTIRKFQPDDWRAMHQYLSKEEVVQYLPYDVLTEKEAKKEALRRSKGNEFYAVCLKSTGQLIGNLYFAERKFGTWEIGYVFNSEFQGKGYAFEAVTGCIKEAFAHGVHRITALCDPRNEASWRLMEKIGMRKEAHFFENMFFKKNQQGNPIWVDTFEYAILSSEWKEK